MTLPTPRQSVSHKRFHQRMNHKKCLRHPLPSFGSFSFFQTPLWLRVNKILQKQTKSYKNVLRYLFQCCILIPRKCPRKTTFQHTVPPSPPLALVVPTALIFRRRLQGEDRSALNFTENTSSPCWVSEAATHIVPNLFKVRNCSWKTYHNMFLAS